MPQFASHVVVARRRKRQIHPQVNQNVTLCRPRLVRFDVILGTCRDILRESENGASCRLGQFTSHANKYFAFPDAILNGRHYTRREVNAPRGGEKWRRRRRRAFSAPEMRSARPPDRPSNICHFSLSLSLPLARSGAPATRCPKQVHVSRPHEPPRLALQTEEFIPSRETAPNTLPACHNGELSNGAVSSPCAPLPRPAPPSSSTSPLSL